MIVNDTCRVVFLHIPKCAGTTVRNVLALYDQHHGRFYDKSVANHPLLGRLDYAHIPLAVLRDYFPEDFDRVIKYRSFALIRDPHFRFPSSLHERFVQRSNTPLDLHDRVDVAREVDKVMASLARHPQSEPISDPDLIHFSRQCDYIFLSGKQIVDSPHTVAEIRSMLNEISDLIGKPIRLRESRNRRDRISSTKVENLTRIVTRPIETVLPRRFWKPMYKPIKTAFYATGLLRPGGNPLADYPNAAEIDAFIKEFYAADIAFFRQLEAKRAAL
ncbi:sulfotransferase family 2 domain-containing protein [Alisedimentitalea sp. MJ-SS2]|uniref:sulfotransferase family 2 domain-containing protein n=1 Tax=Aliisedimentitalea sp. MJ-SS2 TaxID=3049795 RepID=UPI0029133398|nr:sulfotransferase family 2 domain-containing protein [Alisedimentitalea sp. MJ-SS2]MDU8928292.1 sulfotransferase family 2 domain-containing protein [Alisedimentitalea sp. MJ-SS2]